MKHIHDTYSVDGNLPKKRVIGVLYEPVDKEDDADYITSVDGTPMFYRKVAENATLVGGTHLLAAKMLGLENDPNTTKFSHVDEDPSLVLMDTTELDRSNGRVLCGFMLSDDGVTGNFIEVVDRVDKGYTFDRVLPFRQFESALDSPASYATQYGLRSQKADVVSYYTKKFSSVKLYSQMTDGTLLGDLPNIAYAKSMVEVETIVELDLPISKMDLAEYEANRGRVGRSFSAITLLAGVPATVTDGNGNFYDDYREIIATNRVHMDSQKLDRGGDVVYKYFLYFL